MARVLVVPWSMARMKRGFAMILPRFLRFRMIRVRLPRCQSSDYVLFRTREVAHGPELPAAADPRSRPPARLHVDRGVGRAFLGHAADHPPRHQPALRPRTPAALPRRRRPALERREHRLPDPPGPRARGEAPHRPAGGAPR